MSIILPCKDNHINIFVLFLPVFSPLHLLVWEPITLNGGSNCFMGWFLALGVNGLIMFGEREDDAPLQLERENLKVGRSDFSGWIKADNLNILTVLGWVCLYVYTLCICVFI